MRGRKQRRKRGKKEGTNYWRRKQEELRVKEMKERIRGERRNKGREKGRKKNENGKKEK